jgi:hypothetical protein
MGKDELSGTGLDDDEIELIKQRRKQRREEDEREIWIEDGDRRAKVPYSVGRNWLRKHGFDLEDEDKAPEPEPEPEPEEDPEPGKTVRFGRRTG